MNEIKNIKNFKVGITHAGAFHLDDVLSSAMLKMLNPDITIERVPSFQGEGEIGEIVFDIGFGKYDHHQAGRRVSETGVPYSAFGLLFEDYGRLLLENYGFADIEGGFQAFKAKYVSKVDYGDNFGYQTVKLKERDMVMSLNPKWYEIEKHGEGASQMQFEQAVVLGDSILKLWLRDILYLVEYSKLEEKIWNSAVALSQNDVVTLERNIPTNSRLKEYPKIKFVVKKDARSDGYAVYSSDSEKYPLSPCKELSFVHPSGFMGVAKTLKLAQKAASRFAVRQ